MKCVSKHALIFEDDINANPYGNLRLIRNPSL